MRTRSTKALFLAALLLLAITGTVYATVSSIEAYQYLADGYSEISKNTDGSVRVYGYTLAYEPVDTITLDLFLQQWTASGWIDIEHWQFSRANNLEVYGGGQAWVESGRQYRARGVHRVREGVVQETGYSSSSPIIP